MRWNVISERVGVPSVIQNRAHVMLSGATASAPGGLAPPVVYEPFTSFSILFHKIIGRYARGVCFVVPSFANASAIAEGYGGHRRRTSKK